MQNKFGGTTADIEQHGALPERIEQRQAAGYGEARFGFAVDDFERQAQFVLDTRAERSRVGGGAAGFGRDQPHPRDMTRLDLVAADAERNHRPFDGGLAEAAGRAQSLAKADDAGKRIDDAEALIGGPRDQQPAIIGTKVERRIGRGQRSLPARRYNRMAIGGCNGRKTHGRRLARPLKRRLLCHAPCPHAQCPSVRPDGSIHDLRH